MGGGGRTCHDEMSTVKSMSVDKNNADEAAHQKIMNTNREGFNAFMPATSSEEVSRLPPDGRRYSGVESPQTAVCSYQVHRLLFYANSKQMPI